MKIDPEEVRTFVARFGAPATGLPIVFEAVCRWVDRKGKDPTRWVAGLEIIRISSLDAELLRDTVLK